MPLSSVFGRNQPRRGGGGEERGGDACIAPVGGRYPGLGDASIPSPLLTPPAPTRVAPARDRSPTKGDPRVPSPLLTAPAPTRPGIPPKYLPLQGSWVGADDRTYVHVPHPSPPVGGDQS